jgi:4-amino-4-deoxy-L-arabinose transferase-like glycosyltransferase
MYRFYNAIHGFKKWRLVLVLFLLIYTAILFIDLDFYSIQWDEPPHLHGGFLVSTGQFEEYIETEGFYPPMFDIVTGFFFYLFGSSIFPARVVALIFGVLTIWVVFEIANRMYGTNTAIISSLLLSSMPGFFWLSRMAMLETMLMFFFSISLLLFYSWIRSNNVKTLILASVSLGIGFLVKYQSIVIVLIMIPVLIFLSKRKIQNKLGTIFLIILITIVISLPWFISTYEKFSSEILETWFYSLQMGNESRLAYSTRFPWPIFYLIEMVWPFSNIHPISIFVYILTLFGLFFLIVRRKLEDKFLLIGFFVVYSFFTLISSKDWRYITIIFPILAIFGAEFVVSIFGMAKKRIQTPKINSSKKRFYKFFIAVFILLAVSSIVYSIWDTYLWLESEHFNYPVREACQYVAENSTIDETTVAFFPTNYFSFGMMQFFLEIYDSGQRRLIQYPEKAVDVFKPLPNDERFFISLYILIQRFELMNVKYLLLIEWETKLYFELYYDSSDVLENLIATGRFTLETEFGNFPHRMFIIRYLGDS